MCNRFDDTSVRNSPVVRGLNDALPVDNTDASLGLSEVASVKYTGIISDL